jgi:putative NADH-flavin reductase
MKVIVFGAGGRVGRRVVEEALRRGHDVTAVVRDPSRGDFPPGVEVVVGDATDPDRVAQVSRGHEVAITTVGPRPGEPGGLPRAARALLDGLPRAGVPRLVVNGGAGSLEHEPGVREMDRPDFPEAWKPSARAHAEALDVYRSADTGVDWSYISPASVLEPGERTGAYRVGGEQVLRDSAGRSHISMEDYAIALVDEAESPTHVRRRFTVAW